MRSEIKKPIVPAANETAYHRDRRAQAHALEAADANRAEQRRVRYSLIDSTADKWRYSAKPAKD
jgi:hypothetical protein